ncbi:MAG: glycosyltransferase [Pyrinomonadaceae bacterium]|nr:glycosyltransferase [Pyrinomonadaceae bacterium]
MKVSVAMITYNQERFIAQAIESVLMQQADFEYEVVIGEDCSTDKTREIVNQYAGRNPERIRLLLPEKNLGMNRNLEQTLLACRGKYIALLEGDDYWTCASKLQKQVEFLDAHPNCTICFHNALAFYDDGSREPWPYCGSNQKETSTVDDLLRVNFIPTCSVMFRGIAFDQFPDWLLELGIVDWPLHVFYAERGQIGYLSELMSAYRFHSGSAYSMKSLIYQQEQIVRMYEHLNKYLRLKYDPLIKERIFDSWYTLAVAYSKAGATTEAKSYARLCFRAKPFGRYLSRKMKILLRTRTPWLLHLLAAPN